MLRVVAASSLLALIVLCVAWEIWLAPLKPGGTLLALKALPLAVALGGILKGKRSAELSMPEDFPSVADSYRSQIRSHVHTVYGGRALSLAAGVVEETGVRVEVPHGWLSRRGDWTTDWWQRTGRFHRSQIFRYVHCLLPAKRLKVLRVLLPLPEHADTKAANCDPAGHRNWQSRRCAVPRHLPHCAKRPRWQIECF